MGLTQSQRAIWQKARSLGSGAQAVRLTDGMCVYLIARIAEDLGLLGEHFSEIPRPVAPFFSKDPLAKLSLEGENCKVLFERLLAANPDGDTYFACLSALYKARLKYERILSTQPLPTLEQVGPRGLLQYGKMDGKALVGLLFWRKWFYDIDNRSAQETGYLFEPIIAHAIGGTPAPAKRSPVKRSSDPSKGRQVDCILDDRAYEFKIRVTIAASGQGRWQEELDFPIDARKSGYTPVLVCMDSSPNPKLDALVSAFNAVGGETYIGDAAWDHLDAMAGSTMSTFLDLYVRTPINHLIETVDDELPDLFAVWHDDAVTIAIADDTLTIRREKSRDLESDVSDEEMPDDADEEIPG